MNVVLESITSADGRDVSELDVGEVVEHEVELRINGAPRSFTVFLHANILEDVDASIVYGDELLEELLRFEPVAVNKLYSAVGRTRRGKVVVLPLVLAALRPSSVGPRC
jgi:hypothetical protein